MGELRLDPSMKRELISLIINAGLEEDFIEWLKIQGRTHIIGKMDNVPDELILTYVKEKKLVVEDELILPETIEMGPGEDIYVKSRATRK
ncbi:MAG: hypothetical protein QXV51_02105 [Thermosphaera sp.]